MYDYGYSYGYGLIGRNTYNPLINYDWSTTTTSGLRCLRDVGSTPEYNASMYFGRGAYLNGVDQAIVVPTNTTIQTALKRVNGIVTINETSQTLTNYVISGVGAHKDYYLFTRLLTTTEKDSYTNTPEAFYAMAQADSACVLNMPMCETDGYARNMKSYSEGSELVNNGTFDTNSNWAIGGDSTIKNGVGRVYSPDASYSFLSYFIGSSKITTGDACIVRYDVLSTNGVDLTSVQSTTIFSSSTTGRKEAVWGVDSPSISFKRINSITDVTIDNISVKKLSGTYPISNYTTSVRDNAKNLQYGLQTCKFVRDSLGVIQSASDYLECDGAGYAIIPSHTDIVNINMTVNPTSLNGNLLSGGVTKTLTGLTLNADNNVVISNITPTGAITLASGFRGAIKTYKEELV